MVETPDHGRQIETPFGPCQELLLEHFLDHVLPPLQHGLDPARIVATMKSSGKPPFNKIITSNNRWRGFARDPAHCEQSTYDTFKHLEAVVKAIVKVVSTASGDVDRALTFGPILIHLRRAGRGRSRGFLMPLFGQALSTGGRRWRYAVNIRRRMILRTT